jgi:hypothetical protein
MRVNVVVLSLLAAVIGVAVLANGQQSTGKTLVLQKITYGPDGEVLVDEIGRHTWRSDGSVSYDAVVAVPSKGSTHTRSISDAASLRRSDLFFDLGMKLVTPIRDPAIGVLSVLSVTGESCNEFAARVGVPEGEDIYKRRVEQPDGLTSIRLLSPDYNCEVTEAQTYKGSKLLYEVRTLSRLDYTEEALFQIDSSLESVSRAEIAAAHERKYGRRMFADIAMDKRLEELDSRAPAIIE